MPPLSVWADALPPWFLFSFSGCLAAGDLTAVPVTVQSWCCGFPSCRFGCISGAGSLGLWVERVVLPLLLAVVYIFIVFSRLCVFLQCFSVFSPLCSCVGQSLLGRIKIVSVTAFFLMENVLRLGREKKRVKYT